MYLNRGAGDQMPLFPCAKAAHRGNRGKRALSLAVFDIHIVPGGIAAIQLAGTANFHGRI